MMLGALCAGLVVAMMLTGVLQAKQDDAPKAKEYKAVSVSEEDLEKYRSEFLARTNERRKLGRDDKATDRLKTPDDLRYDPILNNAGQWLADLMASYDDANKPEKLECPHEATKIGGDANMDSPVQRIRHFGWPLNDSNNPGAGTEANAARTANDMPFAGSMFADQLMDTNTHYRPFYGYKNVKHGDQDFQLMGVGIGRSQRGNWFCCVVFGNPVAAKLTAEEIEALPAQVIAKINAARAEAGLAALEVHEKLAEPAAARAKLLAEADGNVPEERSPKYKYPGGSLYSDTKGAGLKDAASFARYVIEGDDAKTQGLRPDFKHIGVGIAIDDKGVSHITIYFGHP